MTQRIEVKSVEMVIPAGTERGQYDCDRCGDMIPKDTDMTIAIYDDGDGYVGKGTFHAGCTDNYPSAPMPSPTPDVATLTCEHCGTDHDDKGIRVDDRPNPRNSLGNHKKWCRSNPRNMGVAPKRSPLQAGQLGSMNPATGVITPVAPPVAPTPAPAPVAPPPPPSNTLVPEHYSAQLERQRSETVSEFATLRSQVGNTPLSKAGQDVMQQLKYCYAARQPVLLLGPSGVGKSVAVRKIASESETPVVSLNLTKATRMEALIGQPVFRGSNEPIGWNDGMLGHAVRNGYICNLEEVTRSADTIARLFSITDQLGRSMPMTENPYETSIDVHPDFWLVASGNPSGGGYHTGELDRAFLSRFFVIEVSESLALERDVLTNHGMSYENVDYLYDMIDTMKGQGIQVPNTRDLVQVADLNAAGMPMIDAIKGAIALKQPDKVNASAIVTFAENYAWK